MGDLEKINANADRLNAEADETLAYQTGGSMAEQSRSNFQAFLDFLSDNIWLLIIFGGGLVAGIVEIIKAVKS